MLTLDDIENRLRDTTDARIHFAIVCASKSCPPLAGKAYTGRGLSAALNAQARAFLNDPSKNVFDRGKPARALEDLRLEPRGVRTRRRHASRHTSQSWLGDPGWRAGRKRFRASPNSSITTGR